MPTVTGERPRLYLGVDPGASGGLAAVNCNSTAVPYLTPMPATEQDVWDWVRLVRSGYIVGQHAPTGAEIFAVIEKVGGYMPGGAGNIGSAMFKFGANFGMLKAFLCAAGIPYEEVQPSVWQRAMGVPARRKSMTKAAHKNVLKGVCQKLFPGVTVTLKTCDALLLADFCRRKREGKL